MVTHSVGDVWKTLPKEQGASFVLHVVLKPEGGVSGLPIILFISKVKANVSGIIMRSSVLCGICLSQDRHTNAAHICTDCKVNMCESCRDYHLKMESSMITNSHYCILREIYALIIVV